MTTRSAASVLGPRARNEAVQRMAETQYDILVIGGGVTGAGVALDAATRGLRVALVEMRDYAAGTSSRSGKLIHGGLRYLEQFNFGLVRESLRERALMLGLLCPHLVKPIQFVYPLQHRVWERPYVGAGLILYDTMGGAGAVPRHRHLGKHGLHRIAPGIDQDRIAGALTFYDAQIDDSRHTLEIVRTAAAYGADVASAMRVIGLLHEGSRVVGAHVRDLEAGLTTTIRARHVINATGVWSSAIDAMSGGKPSFTVQASKGVHIMIPREKIDSSVSLFVRAEDSVLFVRTWRRHWLVGTTDTPWPGDLDEPVATAADIEYLLRNINTVLKVKLTRADIDGVFAGLRPLVRNTSVKASTTSRISREHTVETVVPGYTTVVGGKYTTYRVMAMDALDLAATDLGRDVAPCRTDRVPLLGARGLDVVRHTFASTELGRRLRPDQIEHLLGRYGSLVVEFADLVAARPELAEPIDGAERYLGVEAVYAVTHEGALHLDDVLRRRTHIAIETGDRGVAAAAAVADLIAPELGWDARQVNAEVAGYCAAVAAEIAAERLPDDPAAMAVSAPAVDGGSGSLGAAHLVPSSGTAPLGGDQ